MFHSVSRFCSPAQHADGEKHTKNIPREKKHPAILNWKFHQPQTHNPILQTSGRPRINKDNENAAVILASYPLDEEIAKLSLHVLLDPETLQHEALFIFCLKLYSIILCWRLA